MMIDVYYVISNPIKVIEKISMKQYLKLLWLTETVRLVEKDNGRFHDEDINRQARMHDGTLADRIIKRASIIGEQHGLMRAQSEWLNSAKLALVILFLIAIFTGVGLALSALAQSPVNLYWALMCLLGVHFVTLLIWVLSCLFLPSESGSIFVQIWLFLTKKFSRNKTIIQLIPAFISLFGRQIRWIIGLIVNLLWSITLFSALIILIALLSTKHYSFEWQSTLLSPDSIITVTRYLGLVPDWLGFTLPDIEMIRASDQAMPAEEIRSAWAIWLLGVFIVYGLSVRLMLFIFCWLKWNLACQKIILNTECPDYQLLKYDLDPYKTKMVIDNEVESNIVNRFQFMQMNSIGEKNFLVAIEVDEQWNPPANSSFLGFLNNNEQQKLILDFLQQHPAKKLLVAIDSDRSPDRGMMNLISLLTGKSSQCKIWFINQGRQFGNWQESINKTNLEQATVSWLTE